MKISVALCTYNGALFLEEQLKSIAQQTRVPDEMIILDDQATDATVEIARSVCARYQLNAAISVNEVRLGVEKNFSRAMCKATGDVIFFCDQDDVWGPHKVEKMVAPFQADQGVALVYSDGYIVGPQLKPTGETLFSWAPKKCLQDGDQRDVGALLRYGHAPGIKASAVAFAAWVRDLAGPLPEGVAHDSWIAFFGYALGKVVVINEPLYSYRRHEQTSGKSSTNELISGLQAGKRSTPAFTLQDKVHFAQCVYDRMCWLEREIGKTVSLTSRFYEMKRDAQEAERTLKARKAIRNRSGIIPRVCQGIHALVKGDYIAIKGYRAKLQELGKDLKG